MTTTHLFVELLVIGFGALIWIFLLAAAVWNLNPEEVQANLQSISSIFPILSLSYVFGILVDRLADRLTATLDHKHFLKTYEKFEGEAKKTYYGDRRTMVLHGEGLWEDLEYGRSRLRICRGWCVNFLLITFGVWAFQANNDWVGNWSVATLISTTVLLLLCAVACYLSWDKLNSEEYSKIRRLSDWIREQRREASGEATEAKAFATESANREGQSNDE